MKQYNMLYKFRAGYQLLSALVLATLLLASCTKEMDEVRLDPTLSTSQFYNVKSDSATVVGFVVAQGDGFTERGVCYNTAPAPTVNNSKVVYTGSTAGATYIVKLGGLNYATKYYARAYATGAEGTVYGEEITFTTLPVVPTLTTAAITAVTGNSATGGGNVTVTGGAEVTARGVCFGTSHNPTIADSKTTDGKGTGAFVSMLSGLKGNTTYYVRAWATNSAGTGYGPEVTFKTLVDLPKVTTISVTAITKVSANTGGEVTYDGGAPVTARGIVWGTSPDPTINDHKIEGGAGLGSFVSNLTALSTFTEYHVRAYATNSAGTAYGNDIKFITLADIITWYLPGDYVEASYPGSGMSNWSPGSSPKILSTVSSPAAVEGYVYMANASNQWKIAAQPNWDGPNYGKGSPGMLSPTGDNFNSPAGYYKINVNANTLEFSAVPTVWGVIGSATPGDWNSETPLTYYPALQTWRGGIHLKAADFKFRANQDWSYNYGSSAKNETLNAGGDNIAVAVEADYYIVLDLSKPNEYKYSANRWGIIGSATAGQWNSDQNMTWDAAGKVMKATLDLTAGEIKFRANDDWAINLGGALNALTQGGDNIPIASAGNYTITLDLAANKATIVKN